MMRWHAFWREVYRDLKGSVGGAVLFIPLSVLTIGGLAMVDQQTVLEITREARRFQDSGAVISTITAPGQIDGHACDALAQTAGITASGALRDAPDVQPWGLPGASLPTFDVTPGIANVLTADSTGALGLLLSVGAAQTLGTPAGTDLRLTGGDSAPVAGVFPWREDDGRTPGYGYSALVPTRDSRPFDECWAVVWPSSAGRSHLLLTTVLPSNEAQQQQPKIGQVNTTLGENFDGADQFLSRTTRFAPAAALLLGTALGFFAIYRRRLEIATKRQLGTASADLVAISMTETLIWMMVSAGISLIRITWGAATAATSDAVPVFLLGVGIFGSGMSGALIGAWLGTLAARERNQARYAKAR